MKEKITAVVKWVSAGLALCLGVLLSLLAYAFVLKVAFNKIFENAGLGPRVDVWPVLWLVLLCVLLRLGSWALSKVLG